VVEARESTTVAAVIRSIPILRVRVFGHPVAWARPRAQRRGPGIHFFEKPEQADWKRTVVAQILPNKPEAPLTSPLDVRMTFFVPRPQSAPKRVKFPVKRPDCSNFVKIVEDALTGIVWVDDSQIVRLFVEKRFDVKPGFELSVLELVLESDSMEVV
jgi:Holliday junction resolvase RusA-like endonuclease